MQPNGESRRHDGGNLGPGRSVFHHWLAGQAPLELRGDRGLIMPSGANGEPEPNRTILRIPLRQSRTGLGPGTSKPAPVCDPWGVLENGRRARGCPESTKWSPFTIAMPCERTKSNLPSPAAGGRPRMTHLGRTPPFQGEAGKVRFRRTLPVRARSGGGRITERTPAVQPRRREQVKVPHTGP